MRFVVRPVRAVTRRMRPQRRRERPRLNESGTQELRKTATALTTGSWVGKATTKKDLAAKRRKRRKKATDHGPVYPCFYIPLRFLRLFAARASDADCADGADTCAKVQPGIAITKKDLAAKKRKRRREGRDYGPGYPCTYIPLRFGALRHLRSARFCG